MIEKQEIEVPARKETRTVAVICDVCKTRRHHVTSFSDTVDKGAEPTTYDFDW
jgi:hypothetical protein